MKIRHTLALAVVLLAVSGNVPALAGSSPLVHLLGRLWPLAENATDDDAQAAEDEADAFSDTIASCADFRLADSPTALRDYGWVSVNDMPPEIREVAVNEPIGIPSHGIRGDDGVDVFVACGRVTPYPAPPMHRL